MTGSPGDELVGESLARVGATSRRVLRRTDKATTVEAIWSDRRVVVKVLTTADGYWRERWQREAQTYQAFAATPPPFAVPMLLYDEGGVRIVDYVDAEPLHGDRYPSLPLDQDSVAAAVAAVLSVAAWPGLQLPETDYDHMLARASPQPDRAHVAAAIDQIRVPAVAQHGDPLPSNLLLTRDHHCVLVDFEHSGRFLPGYDLALLTCLLAGQPEPVRRIVADAAATIEPTCFAVNLYLVADRETRIHWAIEPDHECQRRLALLDTATKSAIRALRRP